MLQKITNIKKLFQRYKPEAHASMNTVHSTRCILHVANLTLFGVVIILAMASVLIYYLMPVTDVSELSEMIEVQTVETILDTESPDTENVDIDSKKEEVLKKEDFGVIAKRNVFSSKRKEWVLKAVIPKASDLDRKKKVKSGLAKKALARKKAFAGKPKKIILHGIVMAGDLKKALINNPLTGISKKKTIYVEEGEEFEGYRVTSIEKDRIMLDWHGEEIVILLYSGLKNNKQPVNKEKVKAGGLTKLEYKFKTVEDPKVEESHNKDDLEVKYTAFFDALNENLPKLMTQQPQRSEGE